MPVIQPLKSKTAGLESKSRQSSNNRMMSAGGRRTGLDWEWDAKNGTVGANDLPFYVEVVVVGRRRRLSLKSAHGIVHEYSTETGTLK